MLDKHMSRSKVWLKGNWWVVVYLIIYWVLISCLILNRWWQGEIFFFDHGIFDQSLWKAAHGRMPTFDHFDNANLNQFGDHFNPLFYLLIPLYWLTNRYEPLLLVGPLAVVISGLILYLSGLTLKLPKYLAAAVLLAYTGFVGIHNSLIFGFHAELLALITIAAGFWYLSQKNYRLASLWIIISVGFKEQLVGLVLGLAFYFACKKKYALAIVMALVSIGYYVAVTKLIIPPLKGGAYGYQLPQREGLEWLTSLFNEPIKIQTMKKSFLYFVGLPLLSIPMYGFYFQDFFIRFVLGQATAWDFKLHYSTISALILAYGAMEGATRLIRFRVNKLMTSLLILVTLAAMYLEKSPLLMLKTPDFYRNTQTMKFFRDYVQTIPNQGLVMGPNNLIVHLTHSHELMLLRNEYWQFMPQVIAFDSRDGQNPNNNWPANVTDLQTLLAKDPNYSLRTPPTSEQRIYTKVDQVDESYYDQFKSN